MDILAVFLVLAGFVTGGIATGMNHASDPLTRKSHWAIVFAIVTAILWLGAILAYINAASHS